MTKYSEILNEIENVFSSIGMNVKYDLIKTDGGYCKYKDKEYIVINKLLPKKIKINILVKILFEKILNKQDIYIKPALREFLEKEFKNEFNQ